LNHAETQYCCTRRELLSVLGALRHWKHLVLGPRVKVRTDHASLTWLKNFKNPENQMARWLHELSQFDIALKYRAGPKHINADSISRRPCPPSCKYCSRREMREGQFATTAHLQFQPQFDWIVEQDKDEELKQVKDWITTGQIPTYEQISIAPPH
jgi:hypothetical protein